MQVKLFPRRGLAIWGDSLKVTFTASWKTSKELRAKL
jgi:hypothetical protein